MLKSNEIIQFMNGNFTNSLIDFVLLYMQFAVF